MDPPNDQGPWASTWLDNINVDATTYGLPMRLTLLNKLPNEIFLMIGAHLEQGDLKILARVCRRLRSIAETALYTTVEHILQLHYFYRTLIERLDLRSLVKLIDLSTYGYSDLLEFPVDSDEIGQLPIRGTASRGFIIGSIFHLLPSLVYLSLEIRHVHTDSGLTANPLEILFAPFLEKQLGLDVKALGLLHLKKLRRLGYEGDGFHCFLASFPDLEEVRFIGDCDYELAPEIVGHSNAKSLAVSLSPRVLYRGRDGVRYYPSLKRLLAFFPNILRMKIRINRPSFEGRFDEDPARFSILTDMLAPMRASLTHLDLTMEIVVGLPDLIRGTKALQRFVNLRHLKIPFEALFGTLQEDLDDDSHVIKTKPLLEVIPDGLQCLELQYPDLRVLDLLGQFAATRKWDCGSLSAIRLHCSVNKGTDYETFVYTQHMYPGSVQLRTAGIDLSFECPETVWNPDWEDPKYDPLAMATLQHIGTSEESNIVLNAMEGAVMNMMMKMAFCHSHSILPSRWV